MRLVLKPLKWCLSILLMSAGLLSVGAAPKNDPAPNDAQVATLQGQVRDLLGQLDELGELHDSSERSALMRRHWQGLQDYLRQAQELMPAADASLMRAAHGSAAGCALAGTMSTDRYVSQMRDLLWNMREQLADMYQMKVPAQRERLMREHLQATYRGMQGIRGYGWMYGTAAPSVEQPQAVPDSASTAAYLVRQYCGQCHAPPPPALHSANEWALVASKMAGHMNIAEADNPQEVRRPSTQEATIIITYLEANGCEVSN
jgi:hypothetical protein